MSLRETQYRATIPLMANGEEDLREKNRGRVGNAPEKRYTRWSRSLGEENSEMLLEKASRWKGGGKKKKEWNDED